MITICACRQDSAGNHEASCPLNPNYIKYGNPVLTTYCSGCYDKDERIRSLESQLAAAQERLREAEEVISTAAEEVCHYDLDFLCNQTNLSEQEWCSYCRASAYFAKHGKEIGYGEAVDIQDEEPNDKAKDLD